MHSHMFRRAALILVACATLSGIMTVFAQDGEEIPPPPLQIQQVPPVPGELTLDFGTGGDACGNAASSYLSIGMDAGEAEVFEAGEIISGDATEGILAAVILDIASTQPVHAIFSAPDFAGNFVGVVESSDTIEILDGSVCQTLNSDLGPVTYRFWQVNAEGTQGWMVESMSWGMTELPPEVFNGTPDQPGTEVLSQPNPVTVASMTLRLLLPKIIPPVTTIPQGGTDIAQGPRFPCEGGGPSYLNVGGQAIHDAYGYMEYRIGNGLTPRTNLDEFGLQRFADWLAIPVYLIYRTSNAQDPPAIIVPTLGSVSTINPTVDIIDGPVCGTWFDDTSGIVESGDHDEVLIWWQISYNDEIVGWYPENIHRDDPRDSGVFDGRVYNWYLLTPVGNRAASLSADDCEGLLPSRLIPNTQVRPTVDPLNLRETTGGPVIGQIVGRDIITIIGEDECVDGFRWWQTDRGGWVAENDDRGYYLEYPRPGEEPEVTEEPDSSTPPDSSTAGDPNVCEPPVVATSPTDGMGNGAVDFFWDTTPAAEGGYAVIVSGCGNSVSGMVPGAASNTTTVDTGPLGVCFEVTWTVQALDAAGNVLCSDSRTIGRTAPEPSTGGGGDDGSDGRDDTGSEPGTAPGR